MRKLLNGLRLAGGFVLTTFIVMSQIGNIPPWGNLATFFEKGGLPFAGRWIRWAGPEYGDPWLLTSVFVVAGSFIAWPVLAMIWQRLFSVEGNHIGPDMPIHEAIDYLVNDSNAKFRALPPGYGPQITSRMQWSGVEHQDALPRVHERLRRGELKAWGNIEIAGAPPETVDDAAREIEKEFWDQAAPHHLHCFHASNLPQTQRMGTQVNPPRYWHLMLNRKQVHHAWPRKALFTRIADRIRGRPRKTFWQHRDG